jgi:hypothetical protein
MPLLGYVHADTIGREIRTITTKTTEECQLLDGGCLVAMVLVLIVYESIVRDIIPNRPY